MTTQTYMVSPGALAYVVTNAKHIFLYTTTDTASKNDDTVLTGKQRKLVEKKLANAMTEKLHLENSEQIEYTSYREALPVVAKALLQGMQDISGREDCCARLRNNFRDHLMQAGLAHTILNPETNIDTDVVVASLNPFRQCVDLVMNHVKGRKHLNEALQGSGEALENITNWYKSYMDHADGQAATGSRNQSGIQLI